MIPLLFDKTENNFDLSSNRKGIPLSDCISCEVTEELNGEYELKVEYIGGGQFSDQIEANKIIIVKANKTDPPQAFRIYRVAHVLDIERYVIKIWANHITYDILYIPLYPPLEFFSLNEIVKYMTDSFADTLNYGIYNLKFNYTISNLLTESRFSPRTVSITKPINARSLVYDKALSTNSIINHVSTNPDEREELIDDILIRVNNNNIEFTRIDKQNRKDKKILYGVNLIKFEYEQDESRHYSVVLPYAVDGDNIIYSTTSDGESRLLDKSSYINDEYDGGLRTTIINVSNDVDLKNGSIITSQQVKQQGEDYLRKSKSYKEYVIDFVDITSLYNNISTDYISLGDSVQITVSRLNRTWESTCLSKRFDSLNEKYLSITIGVPTRNYRYRPFIPSGTIFS